MGLDIQKSSRMANITATLEQGEVHCNNLQELISIVVIFQDSSTLCC